MSVKVTNQNTPTATTDQLLIVEAFDGTPTPNGRLRQGVYYSFQNTWRNFTEKLGLDKIFVPLTRTIKINGETKSLATDVEFTVSGSGATWGSITGTLSDQTDLKSALDAREVLTNKSTDVDADKASNTKYPSVKAVFDWASSVFATTSAVATQITTALIGYATEVFVNAGLATKQDKPITIKLSGDVTTTSNVSSAITGLVATLEANTNYIITGVLRSRCSGTGGVKYGMTLVSGGTSNISAQGKGAVSSGPIPLEEYFFNQSGALTATGLIRVATALSDIYLNGNINVGATAGDIQFNFASGTNTQTSTIYQFGTWIEIKEVV